MTAATARRSDLDDIHVSALGVTRSEWIKFRSLRSSVWSLLVTLVLTVGLGLLFSAVRAGRTGHPALRAVRDALADAAQARWPGAATGPGGWSGPDPA